MMKAVRLGIWLGLLAGAGASAVKDAPAPETIPVLVAIDPPGLTVGGAADWSVTGRALDGVKRFLISGDGVEVVAVRPDQDAGGALRLRLKVRSADDAAPGFREVRAVGPAGLSNPLLFRVDPLPQSLEAEPNDDPSAANPLGFPSAVAGVLRPQDLDHFAFLGRAGQRVTIEIEARRLGSRVVPVATLLTPSGASLAQSRPLRDGTRDGRLTFVIPEEGRYLVQVRDALYRGAAPAHYRLRIDDGPYADGLFPLGGRRGATIDVTATGGNLGDGGLWRQTITLPDEPGAIVEPGAIPGPPGRRAVLVPIRLDVGDGPEVVESTDPSVPPRLPLGATANGRIGRPGEVDRYVVDVKAGEPIQVEVRASALGSWLDSSLTLLDARGDPIAEGDDQAVPGRTAVGGDARSPDSRLEFEPRVDGKLFIAITDRFGDGGPAYAYRLTVGSPRPDVALAVRLGGGASATVTEDSGALNLVPGTSVPLRFLVTAVGRPGPINVRAEGLPSGVTAEPVLIRSPRTVRGKAASEWANIEGTLVLKVEPEARPALGALRLVARARGADGTTITRRASATLSLASPMPDDPRPPPTRVVTELPVWIVAPTNR